MLFMVQIQRIREKISEQGRNTAYIDGSGHGIGLFLHDGNAVFQDPQCLVHVLIEFLTVFGELDASSFFLEQCNG